MKILLDKIMYQKNLSIRQVSMLSGVPRSTLHDIVSEKISPRLSTLEAIASALHVKISDLYDEDQ